MPVRGLQRPVTRAPIFHEAQRAGGLKLVPGVDEGCRKYGTSLVLASEEARHFDVSVLPAAQDGPVPGSTDTGARHVVRDAAPSKREKTPVGTFERTGRCKAPSSGESERPPSRTTLFP